MPLSDDNLWLNSNVLRILGRSTVLSHESFGELSEEQSKVIRCVVRNSLDLLGKKKKQDNFSPSALVPMIAKLAGLRADLRKELVTE